MPETADNVDKLLKMLRGLGAKFVSLDDDLQYPMVSTAETPLASASLITVHGGPGRLLVSSDGAEAAALGIPAKPAGIHPPTSGTALAGFIMAVLYFALGSPPSSLARNAPPAAAGP